MDKVKGYRFGEPTIGREHSAFRSKYAIKKFMKKMPEMNLVPIYEINGKIISDDGNPDGLQVLVENYRKTKIYG